MLSRICNVSPQRIILISSRGLIANKFEGRPREAKQKSDEQIHSNYDNPNVFGTLSQRGTQRLAVREVEEYHPLDKDRFDKEEYDLKPRKNLYYYNYEIKKYARQGKHGLKKALELFQELKDVARLKPQFEHYSVLLYGCSKAGYTKRAFELLSELRKNGERPTPAMTTCLIEACANCPFPDYGIKRLEWLLTEIKVSFNRDLNLINYDAAIKAYAKLGHLDEAARLIQKMINDGIKPDSNTISGILFGCIGNRESGCTSALRVFKRAKMFEFETSTPTYNLLLRAIRDCAMGPPELVRAALEELPETTSLVQKLKYNQSKGKRNSFVLAPLYQELGNSILQAVLPPKELRDRIQLSGGNQVEARLSEPSEPSSDDENGIVRLKFDAKNKDSSLEQCDQTNISTQQINLLSDDHLDLCRRIQAIDTTKLTTRYDRFKLFGGYAGFIEAMLDDGCKPDIKTISLALQCVEPTRENFMMIHNSCDTFKITRDVDFYDQMIFYICTNYRDIGRLELALEFLELLHEDGLRPTLQVYEALAFGCDSWNSAKQLMSDLNKSSFVVSNPMILNLLDSACMRRDYYYLCRLIELAEKKRVKPHEKMVEALENLRLSTREQIMRQQRVAKGDGESDLTKSRLGEGRIKRFDEFSMRLTNWLNNTTLATSDHPWQQFNVPCREEKQELDNYIRHMKVMDKIKRESLRGGNEDNLGNVSRRAKKLIDETPYYQAP